MSEDEKKVKLTDFSREELMGLAEEVRLALEEKDREDRQKKLNTILQLAREIGMGVSFYDLEDNKRKLDIQYINPDNPSETWKGRGLMPTWLKQKVDAGHSKEEFKVKS